MKTVTEKLQEEINKRRSEIFRLILLIVFKISFIIVLGYVLYVYVHPIVFWIYILIFLLINIKDALK